MRGCVTISILYVLVKKFEQSLAGVCCVRIRSMAWETSWYIIDKKRDIFNTFFRRQK